MIPISKLSNNNIVPKRLVEAPNTLNVASSKSRSATFIIMVLSITAIVKSKPRYMMAWNIFV